MKQEQYIEMLNDVVNRLIPPTYLEINSITKNFDFSQASDILTCSLLKTLATSKPNGKFLELGTGTGLSTSWILSGMNSTSTLTSIDNDAKLLSVAQDFLGNDERLKLINSDAGQWIRKNLGQSFDCIFADTWYGKYLLLDETLSMLNVGGFYIIDDMLPQPNWSSRHGEDAINLVNVLKSKTNFTLTTLAWSTGVIVMVKNQ